MPLLRRAPNDKQTLDYPWERAAHEFRAKVPELAKALQKKIADARKINSSFVNAFLTFANLCRRTLNPSLADQAIEEMVIQHILTERIFRKVFDNPEFFQRNAIAVEIENVIRSLTANSFSRQTILGDLDRFYGAIEATAATIESFTEKQTFLNIVFEKFFQGFSATVADTHGIVYTPQPIVRFMVRSVDDILQREFGKSLGSRNVFILDPFVGTGNFILEVMRQIPRAQLSYKYQHELHAHEVMLLPYYIAAMNIEHEYAQLMNEYKPFNGLSLVDTFELVHEQNPAPIFVIVGNPPYNSNQSNEMDRNKNRRHEALDHLIRSTYIAGSNSAGRTSSKLLFDPYIKAFRHATERIHRNGEGIVAFVTNDSFIEQRAFDGVRKHMREEFDEIYVLDLGGNVRRNPKLSGTTHNVFGIQVGVSINLLVRRKDSPQRNARIWYAAVGDDWRKSEKLDFLSNVETMSHVNWQELTPDDQHSWITDGLREDWNDLLPLGSKDAKSSKAGAANTIFQTYAMGISTNKDAWLYNAARDELSKNVQTFCETYETEMDRWIRAGSPDNLMDFLTNDQRRIKWSSLLLDKFKRSKRVHYDAQRIRKALYRPFCAQSIYFDKVLIDAPTLQISFFPHAKAESENRAISLSDAGHRSPFSVMMVGRLSDLHLCASSDGFQCFPFYTYDEADNREENITQATLAEFRNHYGDANITKWNIFHYVYALLHHPGYREKYMANIKRELPRIPYAPDFHAFTKAGARLADMHVEYEKQPEYLLEREENPDAIYSLRIEKMRLTKDRTAIIYNDLLTLRGIPPVVFDYRLGSRSALEWIIDQYQVSTDKRSGITSDPNRLDDEDYILRLIGQVITVSTKTVDIVRNLPAFEGGAGRQRPRRRRTASKE